VLQLQSAALIPSVSSKGSSRCKRCTSTPFPRTGLPRRDSLPGSLMAFTTPPRHLIDLRWKGPISEITVVTTPMLTSSVCAAVNALHAVCTSLFLQAGQIVVCLFPAINRRTRRIQPMGQKISGIISHHESHHGDSLSTTPIAPEYPHSRQLISMCSLCFRSCSRMDSGETDATGPPIADCFVPQLGQNCVPAVSVVRQLGHEGVTGAL
jgi:hypothetical protein